MVVLYSKPGCPPCHTIKIWMDRHNITYKEFDLAVSEFCVAPTMIIGGQVYENPAPWAVARLLAAPTRA